MQSNIFTQLHAALKQMRLPQVKNCRQLFGQSDKADRVGNKCRYLLAKSVTAPHRILVGHEWELPVHGLVFDPQLGTIGILQVCSDESIAEPAQRHAVIEQFIQRAVLLKHALVEDAQPDRLSLCVELVLVIESEVSLAPNASNRIRAATVDVLRDLMRHNSYLDAIGVSLLEVDRNQPISDGEMRRAFPWLLCDTSAWFKEGSPPPQSQKRLAELSLTDFRVAGRRQWNLHPTSPLHVLHGHNGSGKSSLAEAFELLVSGRVERLGPRPFTPDEDAKTLTNFAAPRAAVAKLSLVLKSTAAGSSPQKTKPPEWSLDSDSPWGSDFTAAGRVWLDQKFSDRLISSTSSDRALCFLQAYFPADVDLVKQRRKALDEFAAAWAALPHSAQQQFTDKEGLPDPQPIDTKLGWLAEPISVNVLESLLMQREQADVAAFFATGVAVFNEPRRVFQRAHETPTDWPTLLTDWDKAISIAVSETKRILTRIDEVLPALEKLNRWNATASAVGGSEMLAQLLNQSLVAHVKYDIASKELDVLATLQEADREGGVAWLADVCLAAKNAESFNWWRVDVRQCRDKLKNLDAARRVARRDFERFQWQSESRADSLSADQPIPYFSSEDFRFLNELFPHSAKGGLGSEIQSATFWEQRDEHKINSFEIFIADDRRVKVTVGRSSGCQDLLEEFHRVRAALSSFVDRYASGAAAAKLKVSKLFQQLTRLHEAARQHATTGGLVMATLLTRLRQDSPLGRALNELLALLTPARWAYRDVSGETDPINADQKLLVANQPVETILNTAELNTLSLAMFLLCAPKLKNPLDLLLLDDPLQNMDELTVTTVARGIRRLLFLWRQDDHWKDRRLAIFLHGEENLERFRRETSCAVNYLPWLAPEPKIAADHPATTRTSSPIDLESPRYTMAFPLVSELLSEQRSLQ